MKCRPNDPCPCGSGKKYKKCHGSPAPSGHAASSGAPSPPDLLARAARLEKQGRLAEAEACIQDALGRVPSLPEGWLALGGLAERAGDIETARGCYGRLVELHPTHALGWFALGNAHARLFAFEKAREAYLRALELDPELLGVWGNLGNVEKYLGRFTEAIDCYLRDIGHDPDVKSRARRHGNLLISLHYDDALSPAAMFDAHADWAACYARSLYPARQLWPNTLEPERPLRLAYLSGSFNGLIVGHFLRNVLASHDRRQYRVSLYSSTRNEDDRTAEIKGLCDDWVEITDLDDEAAARHIRADRIDILVDLDGHSPTGRPLILARKPAPIQVEWLDYFDTTGMETVDYILTDPYTTPADSPQRFSETPVRLPDTRLCYSPPDYAPAVAPTPCLAGAPFTFGSFNRQDKLHPDLLRLWAEIVLAVPGSRLLLKNRALQVPAVRQTLLDTFAKYGLTPDHLVIRGPSPHRDMLAEYAEVDIGLDTFPYNGGLTTCECLWMGVPIVALEAERMIGRQTSAMLRLLGLDDWVAGTPDEYVRLAVEKAGRPRELAVAREGMRARMAGSSLCDAPRFTRDLEAAYRAMWRDYCETQPTLTG